MGISLLTSSALKAGDGEIGRGGRGKESTANTYATKGRERHRGSERERQTERMIPDLTANV